MKTFIRHAAAAGLLAVMAACAPRSGAPAPATPGAASSLPPSAERAYAAMTTRFDRATSLAIVQFMSQYWRLAANPGYNASIDHLRDLLIAAGFKSEGASRRDPFLRVDEYKPTRGWDYSRGPVSIQGDADPLVLSRERDEVS